MPCSVLAALLLLAHACNTVTYENVIPKEDLLDLMVRIAESPEEWERVHRVLSQLGAEKDFYYPSNKGGDSTNIIETHLMLNSSGDNPDKKVNQDESYFSGKGTQTEPITLAPRKEKFSTKTEVTDSTSLDDTGWPDFEDIFRKLKKQRKSYMNNDIPVTAPFEKDFLNMKKAQHESPSRTKHGSATNVLQNPIDMLVPAMPLNLGNLYPSEETAYSFLKSNIPESPKPFDEPPSNSQTETLPNSPPRSVPKRKYITMLAVEDGVLVDRSAYGKSENRSSRPEFHYHRVTSGPRRNGAGAFIAVSVAKEKAPQAATTRSGPQHKPETWNPMQDRLTSLEQKRRKHKRKTSHHQHGQGRHRRLHQPPH